MKKNKKIIAMAGFVFAGLLLCGCSGQSGDGNVHENYIGKWQNNPEEYVTISNSGATLHNVFQVNPIYTSGEVVVEDAVYLSTTNDYQYSYNGDKNAAFFEAKDVVCFTNMQWKGNRISYDEEYKRVLFTGFASPKTNELVFDRGGVVKYHKR